MGGGGGVKKTHLGCLIILIMVVMCGVLIKIWWGLKETPPEVLPQNQWVNYC